MINFLNLQKKVNQTTYLKKNEKTIFGELKYNKEKKELIVSNIGDLETGDLLLGCKKGIEKKKDIIGRNEISSFNFL